MFFFPLFTLTQIVTLPQSRETPPAVTGRRVKTAHKDDRPLFDSILCQCFPSWGVCVYILESSTAINKLPAELPLRENLNGVCSNRLDRQEGLLTLKNTCQYQPYNSGRVAHLNMNQMVILLTQIRKAQTLVLDSLSQFYWAKVTAFGGFPYLLSEFVEFSHTPPQSFPAETCLSGAPKGRQAHCSYLPSLSTSAKLASHNKAGSSLCLVAGCLYPGRAQRNKLLLQACQWVWWLNRLL